MDSGRAMTIGFRNQVQRGRQLSLCASVYLTLGLLLLLSPPAVTVFPFPSVGNKQTDTDRPGGSFLLRRGTSSASPRVAGLLVQAAGGALLSAGGGYHHDSSSRADSLLFVHCTVQYTYRLGWAGLPADAHTPTPARVTMAQDGGLTGWAVRLVDRETETERGGVTAHTICVENGEATLLVR